jgi:F-type H+-transporting ATPase subunit c
MNSGWAYLACLALGAGFAVPVAVLSAAIGQGKVGAAGCEAIARQPEAAGRIQTAMILALALIESLVIYALLIALALLFAFGLPRGGQVLQALGVGGAG